MSNVLLPSGDRLIKGAFLFFGLVFVTLLYNFFGTILGFFDIVGTNEVGISAFLSILLGASGAYFLYHHSISHEFISEVINEVRRVSWPTRREALASTSVVIVVVAIMSIFLYIVDMGLSKFISSLIQ